MFAKFYGKMLTIQSVRGDKNSQRSDCFFVLLAFTGLVNALKLNRIQCTNTCENRKTGEKGESRPNDLALCSKFSETFIETETLK